MFTVNELISITSAQPLCKGKAVSVSGISTDTRTIRRGEAFLAVRGDNFDGHDFICAAAQKQAACVIICRTEPCTAQVIRKLKKAGCWVLQVEDTLEAFGSLARFYRRKFSIPVIAVTGSNGKTTTKDMTAAVLSSAGLSVHKTEGTKNNHIGLPQTLLGLNHGHDACVVELGTNHFGEISGLARIAEPNVGIFTSIGPSHLEYFGNLEGVFREKSSLLHLLRSPGIAIVNCDDRYLSRMAAAKKQKTAVFTFGCIHNADFQAAKVVQRNGCVGFRINRKADITLLTPGIHHVFNALAAVACARIMGVPYADIKVSLSRFTFPCGRLTLRTVGDVRFLDDTYNASPASFERALAALAGFRIKGRKIVVMGDMLELGHNSRRFHAQAASSAAQICDTLVTVGEMSSAAGKSAEHAGLDARKIFACSSSCEAAALLRERILPGKDDIVLVKGSRAMKMENVLAI